MRIARSGVVALAALVVATLCGRPAGGQGSPAYGHAAIVERDGNSVFEVDGAPFFVYGAAFFYERLPRDLWKPSLQRLRALGINTLDLYVPWNWHELADGDFDFEGRTSPRRDLHELLRLIDELDFKVILRPGPVVRNEWRNGGYPAWLLARAEYGMPLHDLLEGRYPPTATLQNARSDDAAAQWLHNATHLRFARRWLERVLTECKPVAGRVIAVALDDDQGAYLDNQTYPAPHLRAYLTWLRDVVHGATGPAEPVFINTYQMKVPASSPVWAMGDWYQSDAYSLGEHDRAQLDFSTALLHTRPSQPMMASEFQAGWLQGPDDTRPRPADPSNTALALGGMLAAGVRGVVNFPAQDTLNPAGWEAPFANAFYAWDAALQLDGAAAPRAAPVAAFGALVSLLGPQLAGATVREDAAIAYLGGSFEPAGASNAVFADVAAQTMLAQHACRDAGLTCTLVDPAALNERRLARYRILIVPRLHVRTQLSRRVAAILATFARRGGRVVGGSPDAAMLRAALRAQHRRPVVEHLAGATFARDSSGVLDGFLSVVNYEPRELDVTGANVAVSDGKRVALPHFRVPAHGAVVVPVGLHLARLDASFAPGDVLSFTDCMPVDASLPGGALELRNTKTVGGRTFAAATSACRIHARLGGTTYDKPAGADAADGIRLEPRALAYVAAAERSEDDATLAGGATGALPIRGDARLPGPPLRSVRRGTAEAYRTDLYREGTDAVVLDNGVVRVVVVPQAGARAFLFEDVRSGRSIFTSVGGLRDDVAVEPPLSTTDRIAKYTHLFPAGTFNRPYDADIVATGTRAAARFAYAAPDVIPNGADYSRRLTLERNARAFTVDEGVDFHRTDPIAQRAVSVTSLSVGDGSDMKTRRLLTPLPSAFTAGTTLHVQSGNALGFYDASTHELATVAWRAGDVEDAAALERAFSIVVRLTLSSGGTARVRYGYESAGSLAEARRALDAADAAAQTAQGALAPARTSRTLGKWRNGLRDRLKSD